MNTEIAPTEATPSIAPERRARLQSTAPDVAGLASEVALFLADLLDANPEPTVITHGRRILHINGEFTRLFGYSVIECVGDDLADVVVPDGLRHEVEMIEHQLQSAGRASLETQRRTRDGELIAVKVFVSVLRLSANASGLFVTYRDLRKQKEEEERLRFNALHDVLTGLANRALYLERLELIRARLKRRPDRNFAIVFIDLDGFKKVNDTLGHAAGDALLLIVADRLRRSTRPQDTVARFGGDEFALLLDDISGEQDASMIAERIGREIAQPICLEGQMAQVTASTGIVLSSSGYESSEEMMRHADHAMYDAKMAGKARHKIFSRRDQ